ncbi:hypothetical protein [Phocaeicola coprophilus]|uniref:hypothetical protein n=1 Tax=Phocaeicola coprophilus TaxID=387090 RepID=UPI0039924088
MVKQNEMQDAHLQLSKSSTEEQLKQYFMGIVELNKSSEEFPINLDDIWPIAYNRRQEAVRALTDESSGFMQDLDYQFLRKNAQNYEGHTPGRPVIEYFLSVSCAEYLIVRKCRPAFEVYRRVFHKVVNGGVNLFGMGKYYTIHEYCQMFGKSNNSFYGLIASYRDEFAMIGSMWYISKSLCKMLEMRNNAERIRLSIREKTVKRQLELEFKED